MLFLNQFANWLIPFICGMGVAAIGVIWRYGKGIVQGMRVLLRARLIDIHEKYVVNNDDCPVGVKDEADEVYSAYHSLGGNGTGTHLHSEIIDAHIKSDEEYLAKGGNGEGHIRYDQLRREYEWRDSHDDWNPEHKPEQGGYHA